MRLIALVFLIKNPTTPLRGEVDRTKTTGSALILLPFKLPLVNILTGVVQGGSNLGFARRQGRTTVKRVNPFRKAHSMDGLRRGGEGRR